MTYKANVSAPFEYTLLVLLATLWGSSYLLIKVAVEEITPVTLIALRVFIAAIFLFVIMRFRGHTLPRGVMVWRELLVQSFLNSIGAWTILAWGQQFVDAGLASVLNSTSPIFVFIISAFLMRSVVIDKRKLTGALLGLAGVIVIIGVDTLKGLGDHAAGQIACLTGAILYAYAAIYGRKFRAYSAISIATGTMIWASVILVPAALILEQPWQLTPSSKAIVATLFLALFCTGFALVLYFRLLNTIGSLGVASQAYLRAGIGLLLGIVVLGESPNVESIVGIIAALLGVVFILWPSRAAS